MCRTFSVRHTETIEHTETYQMCCTFIVCVALLPYVSLTRFGECAAARIHWTIAIQDYTGLLSRLDR